MIRPSLIDYMKILVLMILPFVMSCQEAVPIDLSMLDDAIDVKTALDNMSIRNVQTQNGYWEIVKTGEKVEAKLRDNGNISTIYSLKGEQEEKLFAFANFNIKKKYRWQNSRKWKQNSICKHYIGSYGNI